MITELKKSPLPKNEIITLKRVKELFDFMSNFEYKAFQKNVKVYDIVF